MSSGSETSTPIVRWISPEEFAGRTPFGAITIRRACARGEIPGAVKKCGRWCIPEGAELNWLERDSCPAPRYTGDQTRTLKHVGPRFRELVEVDG